MLPDVVGWRILVKPEEVKEFSDGGIALVTETIDQEQMATTKGLVIKVGPTAFGTEHDIVALKEGDIVHFAKYSGATVKLEDEDYRVLNDEDVILVERGKENG